MSSSAPLRTVEPRPLTPSGGQDRYGGYASEPQLGLRLGPESQIPDHPSSVTDIPRPSNNYGQMASQTLPAPTDVKQLKSQCQFNLREYQALLRRRQQQQQQQHGAAAAASTTSVEVESRLRTQQNLVLANLRMLQDEVKVMVRSAENHRWRKWLLGGAV